MKTYAGDLYVELPGNWDDESRYVYRESDSDIEIQVEPSPVESTATPEGLIEPMIDRLELLGPLENLERGKQRILNQDAATLTVSCRREGDAEATLMRVLVFKPAPSRAITITALAPASSDRQRVLEKSWDRLLGSLKTVDFP